VLLWFGVYCHAHPSFFRDEFKSHATDCESDAVFYSYHIHVLFWSTNEDSIKEAKNLRERFSSEFKIAIDPCPESVWNTTTSPQTLCMFSLQPTAEGPFLTGYWAAYIPLDRFKDTVPWIMRHRGNLDVLVHPNSGCEIYDHVNWPLWGGKKWDLDVSIMHFNCPDCDQNVCAQTGASLILQGDSKKCGLLAGQNKAPFILSDSEKFCSSSCQLWVKELLLLDSDCPKMCDNFTPGTQAHDLCELHLNSFSKLAEWRITQCHLAD